MRVRLTVRAKHTSKARWCWKVGAADKRRKIVVANLGALVSEFLNTIVASTLALVTNAKVQQARWLRIPTGEGSMRQVAAPLRRSLRSRSKNLDTFNRCGRAETEHRTNCGRPVSVGNKGEHAAIPTPHYCCTSNYIEASVTLCQLVSIRHKLTTFKQSFIPASCPPRQAQHTSRFLPRPRMQNPL